MNGSMPAERLHLGSLAHQRSEASCREQRVGCEIGAGPKGDTKLVFAGQDHFEHVQRIEPVVALILIPAGAVSSDQPNVFWS